MRCVVEGPLAAGHCRPGVLASGRGRTAAYRRSTPEGLPSRANPRGLTPADDRPSPPSRPTAAPSSSGPISMLAYPPRGQTYRRRGDRGEPRRRPGARLQDGKPVRDPTPPVRSRSWRTSTTSATVGRAPTPRAGRGSALDDRSASVATKLAAGAPIAMATSPLPSGDQQPPASTIACRPRIPVGMCLRADRAQPDAIARSRRTWRWRRG